MIFEPIASHADTEVESYCDAHDNDLAWLYRKAAEREPRLWVVIGDGLIAYWVQPRSGPRFDDGQSLHRLDPPLRLAPGTRLRLDSANSGRYYDGGDHTSTTRRFCVLDGPFAGTCWDANESVATDGTWQSVDPVKPLA